MSYVRIKDNKSVFLASSYRKGGKVKQAQKYLGKAEVLQVDKKRLLCIFDWAWYQKCCFDKNEEIDDYKKRTLLQEFLYQKAKNKTDKLFSHLASLLRDKHEMETLNIPSSELWKVVVWAEEITNTPQNLKGLKEIRENASAISAEIQKILRKPFPTSCCLLD